MQTDDPDDGRSGGSEALADVLPAGLAGAVADELRSAPAWTPPPAGLRDAVLARIAREAARDESHAGDDPVSSDSLSDDLDDGSPAAVAPGNVIPISRHRSWRRRALLVPAVAASAALFAGGVLVADRLVAAQLRPDARVVEASGTELAPDASASVRIRDTASGFWFTLDVEGLPAAAEGSYYAAWLVAGDGRAVPLGSFHERRTGRAVELWSGVDPADYGTLIVTLQSEQDPAGPSDLVVLRAEV